MSVILLFCNILLLRAKGGTYRELGSVCQPIGHAPLIQ